MDRGVTEKLAIEVVSDVICPWCYIGMHRLEKAASALSDELDITLSWKPFQLDGTIPPEGKDRRQYLEQKFGGPDQARAVYDRVREAGAGDGIPFRFEDIRLTPNTLDAHLVIALAGEQSTDVQNAVVRSLFQAYFERGEDLTSRENMLDLAEKAGADVTGWAQALDDADRRKAVADEIRLATARGIQGVPFMIVDGRYGISGAQPPEVLVQAFRQIVAERTARTT